MWSLRSNRSLPLLISIFSAMALLLISQRRGMFCKCPASEVIPIEFRGITNVEPVNIPIDDSQLRGATITKTDQLKFQFPMDNSEDTQKLIKQRASWSASEWEKEAMRLLNLNKIKAYVIIAVSNSGHKDFTLNFIASLNRNNFNKFVIFCFDYELYKVLVLHGYKQNAVIVPSNWINNLDIKPTEQKWMETGYNKLTQAKLYLQKRILDEGFSILFSDVDVVFLSPGVFLHIDYLIGEYCSPASPTQCFTDFVYMYDQDTDVNTGFFAARPTDLIKDVFQRTIIAAPKWGVDQLAFNYQIRTEMQPPVKYSKAFKGLDKLLYSNGHVYFQRRMNQKTGIQPMVVHSNYAEGFQAKKDRLVSAGMWYL